MLFHFDIKVRITNASHHRLPFVLLATDIQISVLTNACIIDLVVYDIHSTTRTIPEPTSKYKQAVH